MWRLSQVVDREELKTWIDEDVPKGAGRRILLESEAEALAVAQRRRARSLP